MKLRKIQIILVILIVFIIAIIVYLFSSPKQATQNGNQTIAHYSDWSQSFQLNSKQAYGLYHWNNTLRLYLDSTQTISSIDFLYDIDSVNKPANFLFVGDYFALYEEEMYALLEKVKQGSSLFISANTIDGTFYRELFQLVQIGFYYDSIIQPVLNQKRLQFTAKYESFTIAKSWQAYQDFTLRGSLKFNPTIGFGALINSGWIQFGAGKIYLNTTPELFSNYQFLSKDGLKYAKHWLNEIARNQPVYWLELARFDASVEQINEQEKNQGSAMDFIFQNKTRTIGVAMLFIAALLFILFRSKRIQGIIPIRPEKRNMTLIFTNTITSIYFNQRNPYALVKIQRANFFSIIQSHFQIDLNKKADELTKHALVEKSGVSLNQIEHILSKFSSLKKSNTTENELTNLRKEILNFYKKSGIVSQKVQAKLDEQVHEAFRSEWISASVMLIGLCLIVFGTYYLTLGIGSGVLLWPIGLMVFIIGLMMLNKPHYLWSNKQIMIKPLFGKMRMYEIEHLTAVNQQTKLAKLKFKNGEITINYNHLNSSDAYRIKKFVAIHDKL